MRSVRLSLVLFAAALAMALGTGAAEAFEPRTDDVIIRHTGQPLRGLIVEQNDKKVYIKLKDSPIRFPVSRSDIKKILLRQTMKVAYEEAKASIDRADIKARLDLGRECIRKKMLDEAKKDLAALAAEFKTNFDVRELLVSMWLDLGQPSEAMKVAREAVATLGGVDRRVFVLQGQVYIAVGQYQKAEEAFGKAGTSLKAKVGKGEAYIAMSQPEKALELFEPIIADDPTHYAAQLGSGLAYIQMANPARASAHLAGAASSRDDLAGPLVALGSALYLSRAFDEAEMILSEALNLAPDSSDAYCTIGLIRLLKGDTQAAAEKLKEAAKEDPRNGRAQVGLGLLFKLLGDEDSAIDYYRRASEASPRDAYCRFIYADALLGSGKYDDALKEFSAAADLSPGFADACLGAGVASFHTKNYAESARWYQKAVKLAPKTPDALSGLGLAYLGQGMAQEANIELRRALMEDEYNPQALLGLAYIANSELREEEAIGYLQAVLDGDPDDIYAPDALAKIYRNRGEDMEYHTFSAADLPSGWMQRQPFGVKLKVAGGVLTYSGRQRTARGAKTMLQREIPGSQFVRFGAEITPEVDGYEGGLFLNCPRGQIELVRNSTGRIAYRYRDRNGIQPWAELGDWRTGEAKRLQIILIDPERLEFKVRAGAVESKPFIVDTFLVSGRYFAGIFTAAEVNVTIDMKVDNVFIVKKVQR